MGSWQSTQRGTEEVEDVSAASQYRYPPKTGNYFSTHFIMGGEKFDSPQPESFLFGENSDLNFLGSKPVPFPYPPPQANEPTKTLKALINIRRDSLHFVKVKTEGGEDDPGKYSIVFTLDCDVRTSITIYYLAAEEMGGQGVVYTPKLEALQSPTYSYRKGPGQIFSQPDHIFQPVLYENEGLDSVQGDVLPVVLHCLAEEGEEPRQSHVTIGVIEKHSDGVYSLKTLKQKLFVDGLCYLIQEIYGVERKGSDEIIDEEIDDTGAECVVCMCDSRDTLILPCRHLCLCNACADSLRYQANNCPICRAPFRALLQIRALQKTGHSATHPALAAEAQTEGVPPGYELVSLVEALNGPFAPPPPPLTLSEGGAGDAKKKKPKRRGSKDQQSGKEGKRSAGSERSTSSHPPAVEEIDLESLPPPPPSPPTLDGTVPPYAEVSDSDVTIVDEKLRRSSIHSSRKPTMMGKTILPEDCHKIKLEVVSHEKESLRSSRDSDVVEEELARMKELSSLEPAELERRPASQLEEDEEEAKEPTTEDELLKDSRDDKAKTRYETNHEEGLYEPEYVGSEHEDEGEEEDDDVEVVSLKSQSQKQEEPSLPGTPRSATSGWSSQESATSVNSSKQLLDKVEEAGGERRRRGKSAVAPHPEN